MLYTLLSTLSYFKRNIWVKQQYTSNSLNKVSREMPSMIE